MQDKKSKTTDRSVVAEKVTVRNLREKYWYEKNRGPWVHHWVLIALVSLTLGLHPNPWCPWAEVLPPPSSGSSLHSWPEPCHRCACPQPCLLDGLQTYATVCLQTCFLVDFRHTLHPCLQPCLWPHLLLLLPGLPGWILDFIHHLNLSVTADEPCYQHLVLSMLSRFSEPG